MTSAGWPFWRASRLVSRRGGLRYFHAASTSNRRAWLEPALVIAPCRRCWPLECSDGTRPTQLMICGARSKRSKSPISATRPAAVSRWIPRRQRRRGGSVRPRAGVDACEELALELLAARAEEVEHPEQVEQRRLRGGVREHDLPEPEPVIAAPPGRLAGMPQPIAQQHLAHAVPRAHQVSAEVLAGTDELAQAFLGDRWDADLAELPGHQAPHQEQRVALVRLHAIARLARHQARGADHHLKARLAHRASEREAGRSRFIGDSHLAGQLSRPLHRPEHIARQARLDQLARAAQHCRGRDRGHVHVHPDPRDWANTNFHHPNASLTQESARPAPSAIDAQSFDADPGNPGTTRPYVLTDHSRRSLRARRRVSEAPGA